MQVLRVSCIAKCKTVLQPLSKGAFMQPVKPGYVWICRPYITLKNGRVLWAHTVGKRAFCFWVKAA